MDGWMGGGGRGGGSGGCKVAIVPVLYHLDLYGASIIALEYWWKIKVQDFGITVLDWTRGKHRKPYPQLGQDKAEGAALC